MLCYVLKYLCKNSQLTYLIKISTLQQLKIFDKQKCKCRQFLNILPEIKKIVFVCVSEKWKKRS